MVTQQFQRDGRALAYSDEGKGQPVVLVPGLGDLKESYRFLVPTLVKQGYRAICLDVRGHGESDAFWDDYSVAAVGADVLALVQHLGLSGVHYVGNSMAAGAGIWATVEAPKAFRSAVFLGPFYQGRTPTWMKAVLGPLFWRPWGVSAWLGYYSSLLPTRKPVDFAAYRQRLRGLLQQPGRLEATRAMMFASKEASGERVARYALPTLVVMGSRDPDFRRPAAEAERIAVELKGQAVVIEGAGHYPQAEFPEETMAALLNFWKQLER